MSDLADLLAIAKATAKPGPPGPKGDKGEDAPGLEEIVTEVTPKVVVAVTPAVIEAVRPNLPKGDPGPKGDKGEDAPRLREIVAAIEPLLPPAIKGDPGPKGDKGEDAPSLPAIVEAVKPDLVEALKPFIPKPAGGGGGSSLPEVWVGDQRLGPARALRFTGAGVTGSQDGSVSEVDITAGGAHPDAAAHDAMGLATDSELTAHAATPHGGAHPDAAAHDAMGLATDSELSTHAADTTAVHGIADTANLILEGDARLADARTPLAHKASHENGGADAVTPAGIGAATAGHGHGQLHDRQHSITAVADHTFPGGTSTFLRADGTFAAAGGGAGTDPPEGSYAPGSYTIPTGKFRIAANRQAFAGSERLTIEGTGRLSVYN